MAQAQARTRGAVLCNSNFFRLRGNYDSDCWDFYKCTTLTNFKLNAEALSDGFKLVIVAGLDSIVSEAKSDQDLQALHSDFSNVLFNLTRKNLSITVAPIIPWKNFNPATKEAYKSAVTRLKDTYKQALIIESPGRLAFESDGIHLTDACARKLLDSVMKKALDHAAGRTDTVTETEDDAMDTEFFNTPLTSLPPSKSFKRKLITSPEPGVQQLSKEVKKLKQDIDERRVLDYMVFARHQEELDQIKNSNNLHKIVIYGLEIVDLFKVKKGPPRDQVIKVRVMELFKAIDEEYDKSKASTSSATEGEDDVRIDECASNVKITFVRHLNGHLEAQNPPRQIVEVRLRDQRDAGIVRRRFGALSKIWRIAKRTPTTFSGITVTNCVTKETRVRIDIMQAIVKVIKANSPLDAYVIQHIPRPLVKVINRHQMSNRSYGFTEIIAYVHSNFPGKLSDQDLLAAYNKAGSKYGPEISHYFVVLKGRDYPLTSR